MQLPARLVLALLVVSGCSSATPTASPPSVQASAAVTTAPPGPSPTPEGIAALELTASASLVPGRYTRSGFAPRITFLVDDPAWAAVQLFGGFFDIQRDQGTPDVIAVQFAKPEAIYGADDIAVSVTGASNARDTLKQNPTLKLVEESTSKIGGLDGVQLTVETAGDTRAHLMDLLPGALSMDPGRKLWVAFFDTPDGLLAIMIGGSVAKWQAALDAAEPVLETVTIGA